MSNIEDEFVEALGTLTFKLVEKAEGLSTTALTFHRTQWFDINPDDDEKIRPAKAPRTATAGHDTESSDGLVRLVVPTAQSSEWTTGQHYFLGLAAFDAPPE